MPEVQNVGAVDYAQYQPSQYPEETYSDGYNTQPVIYDEQMAEMQAHNRSRLGANALSVAASVGIGLVGGYFIGKRGKKDLEGIKENLENVQKELDDLKNSEAVKNYEKLKTAVNDVEKYVEQKSWYNFFGVKNKIKEAFGFMKDKSKMAAKDAKEDGAKVVEGAKKTTEEASTKTDDAAK